MFQRSKIYDPNLINPVRHYNTFILEITIITERWQRTQNQKLNPVTTPNGAGPQRNVIVTGTNPLPPSQSPQKTHLKTGYCRLCGENPQDPTLVKNGSNHPTKMGKTKQPFGRKRPKRRIEYLTAALEEPDNEFNPWPWYANEN